MSSQLNRRVFLARAGALAAGAVVLPGVASAAPVRQSAVDGPVPSVADPTELTLAQAAVALRAGRITSEELVRAHLDRIAAFDAVYKAFNVVLADAALAAARRADRQRPRSPLHGIPLAIKDNYYTAGVPTTANSFIFAGFVPPYDATAVARLTGAGGIVLGKAQMGPLATTRATLPNGVITTVNAWAPTNPAVDPGGSSTGPATSVAGRLATSSIGTQTGGSIVEPSMAQNLTGLKPTMGRVSLHGVVPLTYSRDHPGPLARDAMDAAIMLSTMAGPDPADFRTQGLPPLPDLVRAATPGAGLRRRTRIGVIPGYADNDPVRAAFLDTLAGIRGAEVVDVALPDEWTLLTGTEFNNARLPERAEPFRPFLVQDPKLFGVSLLSWLQGLLLSGDEWITGQRAKTVLLQRVLDGVFAACDVVVQTSAVPFDILGLPEIALPIGRTAPAADRPLGLPIGTILGGAPYEEDRLLEVVAAYQAVTDWHRARPEDPPAMSTRAVVEHRIDAVDVPALSQ